MKRKKQRYKHKILLQNSETISKGEKGKVGSVGWQKMYAHNESGNEKKNETEKDREKSEVSVTKAAVGLKNRETFPPVIGLQP